MAASQHLHGATSPRYVLLLATELLKAITVCKCGRIRVYVHDRIDAAVAGVADPVERILALFDRFFELVLTDDSVRAYFVLYGALISNRLGPGGVFEDVQGRFGARIAGLIRSAQTAQALPADLPTDHAAFMVGSLLAGISIEIEMESFDRNPRSTGPMRANLAAMLRRALGG